jgi:hypothetical protein
MLLLPEGNHRVDRISQNEYLTYTIKIRKTKTKVKLISEKYTEIHIIFA